MTNVVELQAHRDEKLFDAHRAALTELICSYTVHMNHPDLATLERFLEAQDRFVATYHAVQ